MTDRRESHPEVDLDRLSEEELIACAIRARADEDRELFGQSIARLSFGRYNQLKLMAQSRTEDRHTAEDLVAQAIESAVRTAVSGAGFRGTSTGEFVNWLKQIMRRRIADHQRSRLPQPAGSMQEEELDGIGPVSDPAVSPDPVGMIFERDCVAQVLSELNPVHREVFELFIAGGLTSREIVSEMGRRHGQEVELTEANVDKIKSRARASLRKLLNETD